MDRAQLLLLGLPLFLFCSDLLSLFTPPPTSASFSKPPTPFVQAPQFPNPTNPQGVVYGATVDLKFCASCSYKGTAATMKKMLETSFPGIDVILSNYPPTLPKRILSKLVPIVQVGVIAIITAGDQIFPRLGIAPPSWYFNLRANRFGAMASTWLLGNFVQSSLQSSGAFEVYYNGDLVFSKLKEQRFPSEFELRELIGNRMPESAFGKNLGKIWS